MDVEMRPVTIALMNTVFRMATVLLLIPFIPEIEKLVYRIIKDEPEDIEEQADFDILEERFLAYPALAIGQSHTCMNSMAKKARKNLNRAFGLITSFSQDKFNKVQEKENLIDQYEDKLGTYLMQLTGQELTVSQTTQVTKFLHTISDFERLGDHAVNIALVSEELHEKKFTFSETGRDDIEVLESAAREIVDLTVTSFCDDDLKMAARVEPLRELIGMLCTELKNRHVNRLRDGKCEMKQGFAFNDLLTNFERIAAHCSNVAAAMLELEVAEFDTHEYLRSVRQMKNEQYLECFEEYAKKYAIAPTKKELAAAKKESAAAAKKEGTAAVKKETTATGKKESTASAKKESVAAKKKENVPEEKSESAVSKKENAHPKKEHASSKKEKKK
jgi:phosphate:Na+ symporter